MCSATGKAAAQNLYEALRFQHSLAPITGRSSGGAVTIFEIDHQPELGRSWA